MCLFLCLSVIVSGASVRPEIAATDSAGNGGRLAYNVGL